MNGHEQVILDYFERTCIGVLQAGVKTSTHVPHVLWNVHNRLLYGKPRRTNADEGWHHPFKTSHANIWKFVDCLKREHASIHLKIA